MAVTYHARQATLTGGFANFFRITLGFGLSACAMVAPRPSLSRYWRLSWTMMSSIKRWRRSHNVLSVSVACSTLAQNTFPELRESELTSSRNRICAY